MTSGDETLRPVDETDLHAFADGKLDARRRAEVEAWLDGEPQERARVEAWRQQSERLAALFEPALAEPVPPQMLAAVERAAARSAGLWPRRIAAAAMLVLVGAGAFAIGRYTAPVAAPQVVEVPVPQPPPSVAVRAANAHRVFVVEVRHAVEVKADEQHLVAWLTKRMGGKVAAPDLQPHGFRLVGGRLLAGERGPAAQLMYEDSGGRRLTAYVARSIENRDTAFRFEERDGLSVFWWRDGQLAWALSAEMDRARLLPIAETVYQALQ